MPKIAALVFLAALAFGLMPSRSYAAGIPSAGTTPSDSVSSTVSLLKTKADAAMDRADYAAALSAYRQAYAMQPSAVLLYNIGRAEDLLGHYAESLACLEAFEAMAPAELKAKVPRLPALLERLRTKVGRLSVRTPVRGAIVVVGGEPRAATPIMQPLAVNPGMVTVEVRADGYLPYRKTVAFEAGRTVWIDAPLVRGAGAATTTAARMPGDVSPDTSSTSPLTKKWWFWTGVGAVVLVGTGVTVALMSERSPPRGDIGPQQVASPLLRF